PYRLRQGWSDLSTIQTVLPAGSDPFEHDDPVPGRPLAQDLERPVELGRPRGSACSDIRVLDERRPWCPIALQHIGLLTGRQNAATELWGQCMNLADVLVHGLLVVDLDRFGNYVRWHTVRPLLWIRPIVGRSAAYPYMVSSTSF